MIVFTSIGLVPIRLLCFIRAIRLLRRGFCRNRLGRVGIIVRGIVDWFRWWRLIHLGYLFRLIKFGISNSLNYAHAMRSFKIFTANPLVVI